MSILAIDTTNQQLGVAVGDNQTIYGEFITNIKKNHSVRLMPAIEYLLKEVGIKPKELTRIVVAKGPGSYTGVRIGVTTAKTLAWSLGIPLVGISSLELLAQNGCHYPGLVSPLFDARRERVYTGLYKMDGNLSECVKEDQNIAMVDWLHSLKELDQQVLFVGNDVSIYEEKIIETLGDQAAISSLSERNPRPSELIKLGEKREPEDVHAFVPNYVRLAEAEAKWLESRK